MIQIVQKTKENPIKSIVVCLVFALVLYIALPNVISNLKIKDPSNSKFDVSSFSFYDYTQNSASLLSALNTMFPSGTKKNYVDNILIDIANSQAQDHRNDQYNFVTYSHKARSILPIWFDCPAEMTWTVKVYYDQSEQVTDIKLKGPCI